MELKHNNVGKHRDALEIKREETSDEKKRKFTFFKNTAESLRRTVQVLAIAVGTTVMAYGCFSNTSGRYRPDDPDTNVDVIDGDTATDSDAPDVPDVESDVIEDPELDTDTDTEDVIDDSIDVEAEDTISEDTIEEDEPPIPTCFTIPTPIDPTTASMYNNSSSQDAVFNNSGPEAIYADLETNVSMTGYSSPSVSLGVCPDNPNAYAYIENPGSVIAFAADVSMEAASVSWTAEVPVMSGITCPGLAPDSETLIAKNTTHQQVPKNADMSGTTTHAGFDLMPVTSTLVAYNKSGSIESDGILTVGGADFSAANTISALVLDGDVDIDVEVRAGDSSASHIYTATITGTSSKEARIYATGGDQMYDIVWDTSNHYFCSRCTEHRVFDLVISGDLLCKIADSCGCVGDGFDIAILGVSIDASTAPPHLRTMVEEASAPVRSATGVSAFSDPTSDHPSITIRLNRGSVSFDDGVRANFYVNVNVELTSEHVGPDGAYDTRTVTIRVPVVDPWAWGSMEPLYSTVCPTPCTLSY